jgi:hypothetical protein
MTGMVSMERPKPEVQEKRQECCPTSDPYYEKYPYGLRIDLGTEELKKLGIDLKNFKLNQEVLISAKCSVIRLEDTSSVDMYEGNKVRENQRLELQVTELAIENPEDFQGAFNEAIEN